MRMGIDCKYSFICQLIVSQHSYRVSGPQVSPVFGRGRVGVGSARADCGLGLGSGLVVWVLGRGLGSAGRSLDTVPPPLPPFLGESRDAPEVGGRESGTGASRKGGTGASRVGWGGF